MIEAIVAIVISVAGTAFLLFQLSPKRFNPHGVSNRTRHAVQLSVIGLVVGISLVDLFLMLYFGNDATISVIIRQWNDQWQYLSVVASFAVGALFGHWFLTPKRG